MIVSVLAILTLGAFVQGFFGFGFGALAVALLTIELPTKAAIAQVVAIAPVSTVTATLIQRQHISYRGVVPLALGTFVFFPVGVWMLFVAPEASLHIALGTIVTATALMQIFPGRFRLMPPGPVGGTVAAGLSGIFGGAIGVPGLTMTAYIYGREKNPDVARASLQFFFLSTTFVGTVTHAVAGTITPTTLRYALISALPVVVAIRLGLHLAKRMNHERLKLINAVGLGILGAYTILRSLSV